MATQIQSLKLEIILTIDSVPIDITAGVMGVTYRMAANVDSELNIQVQLFGNLWTTPPEVGDTITAKYWYESSAANSWRSGTCWIYSISSNGFYLNLKATNYNPLLLTIPSQSSGDDIIYEDKTLRNIIDLAVSELNIGLTGVSAAANTTFIGTAENPNETIVKATGDRSYLEMVYEWARRFGFMAYAWRNAFYCEDYLKDYALSTGIPTYKIQDTIESRVEFTELNDVRRFIRIYRLPNFRTDYTITWVRSGRTVDVSSEGYYKDVTSRQRRRIGLSLEAAGSAKSVMLVIPGTTDDKIRPGTRISLQGGFADVQKGEYIINEVTQNVMSPVAGWQTSIRATKAYAF